MNEARYLLDTDIASYLIGGRDHNVQAKVKFAPPSSLCTSVIVQAELLFGLKRIAQSNPLHQDVERFLRLTPVLSWDDPAGRAYADIRQYLAKSAQTIGELDMMIAAHALSLGAVLVTNNTRHHLRLSPPLQVENWAKA